MYISTQYYGDLHPITGFFKNREMEQLYKRYLASYHRKYLVWCFVILAVLNTLMFVVDMRNISLVQGWGLFALRGLAYVVLGGVMRLLLKGGFSRLYCRVIFVVAILMAVIALYRYDILYHMQHQGFDFEFQISALILLYILCASMIILPIMAQYVIVSLTAIALIVHTIVYEPDGFIVHKTSWAVYGMSTIAIVALAIWIRRHSRYQFYHFHLKPKVYERATEKNTILSRIKNAFMANATAQVLAHELKTPLATAYGYAQMNNDTPIQKALEKMTHIIQNIDYLGKGKIKKLPFSIKKALQGTSDLWLRVAEDTHGKVRIVDNTDSDTVCADQVLLQGAIANVVRNGLQARPHGTVTVTLTNTDTHMHIRISNNTPRPPYLNDNVFMPMWDQDMWHQDMWDRDMGQNDIWTYDGPPHQKPHKKSESVGIGLAFVYETITHMNGKVYIDYETVDTTDFVLEIPRHSPS